jgi:hypothetical protein
MLLDSKGQPVSSTKSYKKDPAPKTGEVFATWGDNSTPLARLPMGGIVQFNLDNLRVADFRNMRTHYQVNSSLAVLAFMQHQSDWHVECDDQKVADECEYQLRAIWTQLNRGMATANWAGYSPNILQYENSADRGKTELSKIKDLVPESAAVHWKEVDAWRPVGATPHSTAKVKIYDGIKQLGAPWPTPVDNTFWYPLLMENGNYEGTQLLKAAFTSWYFSILIHLFANRYYERFGEPIVKGRAPFEENIRLPGSSESVPGVNYMLSLIQDLRNRSVVVLPDSRTENSKGQSSYDYDLEYLESQMRGADWERYLTRLDEEISIGMFTPILLLRTADVGSYNLGVGHMQMYLWMLNAMNADRAQYIDKYILAKIANFTFSPKAPRPHIKFRKLGNQNADLVKSVLMYLLDNKAVMPDVKEVGEISGMSLEQIKKTIEDTPVTPPAPGVGNPGPADPNNPPGQDPLASGDPKATQQDITARVARQVENHFANGGMKPDSNIDMGYRRRLERILGSTDKAERVYAAMDAWISDCKTVFKNPGEFNSAFSRVLEAEIADALK